MSTKLGTISRRRLFALSTGVALSTGCLSAGAVRIAQGVEASVAILGHGAWQLALLIVQGHRILIVLGTPVTKDFDSLGWLLGAFLRRIDLVVSDATIDNLQQRRLRQEWSVRTFITVAQAVEIEGPPARSLDQAALALGHGFSLLIEAAQSDADDIQPDGHARWNAILTWRQHAVIFSSGVENLRTVSIPGAALVITPGRGIATNIDSLPTACFALNTGNIPKEMAFADNQEDGVRIVRTFSQEAIRFIFRDEGVAIPDRFQMLPSQVHSSERDRFRGSPV